MNRLNNLFEQAQRAPISTNDEQVIKMALDKKAIAQKWYNLKKWTLMSTILLSIMAIGYFIYPSQQDITSIPPTPAPIVSETTEAIQTNEISTLKEEASIKAVQLTSTPVKFSSTIEKEIEEVEKQIQELPKKVNLAKHTAPTSSNTPKIFSVDSSRQIKEPIILENPVSKKKKPALVKEHYYLDFQIHRKADMEALTTMLKETEKYGVKIDIQDFEIKDGIWKKLVLSFRYKRLSSASTCTNNFVLTLTKFKLKYYYGFSWMVAPGGNVNRIFHWSNNNEEKKTTPYTLKKSELKKENNVIGDTVRLFFSKKDGKQGIENFGKEIEKMGYRFKLKKAKYDNEGHIQKLKMAFGPKRYTYKYNIFNFKTMESYWVKNKNGTYRNILNNINYCGLNCGCNEHEKTIMNQKRGN